MAARYTNKMNAQQIEVAWDQPEPFQLVIEQAADGERITHQKARREQDRAEAEKQQPALINYASH